MKRFVLVFAMVVASSCITQKEEEYEYEARFTNTSIDLVLHEYTELTGKSVELAQGVRASITMKSEHAISKAEYIQLIENALKEQNVGLFPIGTNRLVATWIDPSLAPSGETGPQDRRDRRRNVITVRGIGLGTNDDQVLCMPEEQSERKLPGNLKKRKRETSQPVLLSSEMDDQLVKEGILPPENTNPPVQSIEILDYNEKP